MVSQKYKVDVILDLVFIILGPLLQIINVDRLITNIIHQIIYSGKGGFLF